MLPPMRRYNKLSSCPDYLQTYSTLALQNPGYRARCVQHRRLRKSEERGVGLSAPGGREAISPDPGPGSLGFPIAGISWGIVLRSMSLMQSCKIARYNFILVVMLQHKQNSTR